MMRNLLSSLLTVLFLWAAVNPISAAEPAIPAQNPLKTVTLDVQNMTCPLCKFTIRKALQKVAGVVEAQVDPDVHTATVTFDPQKASVEDLIRATTDAGYPASLKKDPRS